jgi:hypothetical protein
LENNVITSENIENHPFIEKYKKELAKEIAKQLRRTRKRKNTIITFSHFRIPK